MDGVYINFILMVYNLSFFIYFFRFSGIIIYFFLIGTTFIG